MTRNIVKEVISDNASIKEEEVIGMHAYLIIVHFFSVAGCQVYFRSLCNDNKRKLSGKFNEHRLKQKRTSRLKHVCIHNYGYS